MARVLDNPWFEQKRLRSFVRRYAVDLVVVFGSHARGEANNGSDLDVAVRTNQRAKRPADRADIADALWDCTIDEQWEVQMVLINTVEDPLLLFEIAEDGRLIYERFPDQWILQRWRAAQYYRAEAIRRKRFDDCLDWHLEKWARHEPVGGPQSQARARGRRG